ncbi:MAG: hypothetical protein IJP54_07235 [Synergistaceae bacterium]|nr:hypothetical protein [Synergistaceae bacterium]MBR0035454.1 hypothetical protein [Synergistaceae bacterium]
MAIPVVRLVKSMRYALKDMQGIKYSDYELVESINQAASLLYSRLSERYVYAAQKQTTLVVGSTGQATLPSDFVRLHQLGMGSDGEAIPISSFPIVDGTYRIIGNTIYASPGAYSLEYYYVPSRVKGLGDDLDVPVSMSPYIEQISVALFGNNLAQAEQIVLQCSQTLAVREVSHFTDVGPVQVLGGKI